MELSPPTSEDAVYMHVCPDLLSNTFMHESMWTFMPDVMKEISLRHHCDINKSSGQLENIMSLAQVQRHINSHVNASMTLCCT